MWMVHRKHCLLGGGIAALVFLKLPINDNERFNDTDAHDSRSELFKPRQHTSMRTRKCNFPLVLHIACRLMIKILAKTH